MTTRFESGWAGLLVGLVLAAAPPADARADEAVEALQRLTAARGGELHGAVRAGELKRVRKLLKGGADPNGLDRNSQTPLIVAASTRGHEAMALLLEGGADPNVTSKIGWSPLHAAVLIRDRDSVLLLLKAGASPQPPHDDNWTPLHQAAQDHREGEFVAWYLQQEGVEPLTRTKRTAMTALHVAAQNGRAAVVRAFLAHGLSTEEKAGGDWTALHCAAARGHEEVVQALLAAGADAASVSTAGETALQLAERKGHAGTVALLRAASASQGG